MEFIEKQREAPPDENAGVPVFTLKDYVSSQVENEIQNSLGELDSFANLTENEKQELWTSFLRTLPAKTAFTRAKISSQCEISEALANEIIRIALAGWLSKKNKP